jgi:hypothetical protein
MVILAKIAKRDPRLVPGLAAASIVIATIPSILAYLGPSRNFTITMLWIFIPLSYAPFGPTLALMQNLVPASMRAQTIALLLFSANIANLVIAPQAVGFASDMLAPTYGGESLRHALIPLGFAGFWAAWHYGLCAKHLMDGLARAGNGDVPRMPNIPAGT